MRGVAPARDEGEKIAGCRPRATRSFCFGKRTQNHWRPGVAPRGVFAPVPFAWGCGTRFAQTVLAPKIEFAGPGRSHARRRREMHLHFLSCPARSGIQGLCFQGFWVVVFVCNDHYPGSSRSHHWRPGVAPRVPVPPVPLAWAAIEREHSGPGRSQAPAGAMKWHPVSLLSFSFVVITTPDPRVRGDKCPNKWRGDK